MRQNNNKKDRMTYYKGRDMHFDEVYTRNRGENRCGGGAGREKNEFVDDMVAFGSAVGDLYRTAGAAWEVVQQQTIEASSDEDSCSSEEESYSSDENSETLSSCYSDSFSTVSNRRDCSSSRIRMEEAQALILMKSLKLQAQEIERQLVKEEVLEEIARRKREERQKRRKQAPIQRQASIMKEPQQKSPNRQTRASNGAVSPCSRSVVTSKSARSFGSRSTRSLAAFSVGSRASVSSFVAVKAMKKSAFKLKNLLNGQRKKSKRYTKAQKTYAEDRQDEEEQKHDTIHDEREEREDRSCPPASREGLAKEEKDSRSQENSLHKSQTQSQEEVNAHGAIPYKADKSESKGEGNEDLVLELIHDAGSYLEIELYLLE